VSQVVQSDDGDAGAAGDPLEGLREGVGVDGLSVAVGEHPSVIVDPDGGELGGLQGLPPGQHGERRVVEVDVASATPASGLSEQAKRVGHSALGSSASSAPQQSTLCEGRGTINVESIDGDMIIQQYRAVGTVPARVEICSAVSRVYHLHLVPERASVRWLLTLTPMSASSSALTCSVFLKRHLNEGTPAFAADTGRKHTLASVRELLAG
jgi:hypothetical protein